MPRKSHTEDRSNGLRALARLLDYPEFKQGRLPGWELDVQYLKVGPEEAKVRVSCPMCKRITEVLLRRHILVRSYIFEHKCRTGDFDILTFRTT